MTIARPAARKGHEHGTAWGMAVARRGVRAVEGGDKALQEEAVALGARVELDVGLLPGRECRRLNTFELHSVRIHILVTIQKHVLFRNMSCFFIMF